VFSLRTIRLCRYLTPLSTRLSSDSTYASVNQPVQMLVSGRNGQQTGRNVLRYYDVIFTEVPAL
jgi:hypothetical protein